MSYWNWVNLQYADFGVKIEITEIETDLKNYLSEQEIHHDVAKDVIQLFATSSGDFRLYTGMVDNLLLWISKQRPSIQFGVQGRGEELRDIWVREYSGGEVTYSQGPFE
jgi:hypothetical protein